MNTKIFTKNELSEAAAMIRNGGIVVMPTETVYGLAANAFDAEAIQKVFAAKGRQADNPLIVHIANNSDWEKLVEEIPPKARQLADRFWPGPLTIILKKKPIVPDIVSGGLDTVAVRMPKNKIAFRFIRECGCPLAAPSANLSGCPSPTKLSHVMKDMNGRVDGIIEGGDCMVGLESTVISLVGDKPIILRPGRITAAQISKVIGDVEIHHAVTGDLAEGEKAASPGMKYKHYAPNAAVTIVDGSEQEYIDFIKENADEKTAVICFNEMLEALEGYNTFPLGAGEDSVAQSKKLFDVLRAVDDASLEKAYAPMPSAEGVGLAVNNRLLRAAGFNVIKLSAEDNENVEPEQEVEEVLIEEEEVTEDTAAEVPEIVETPEENEEQPTEEIDEPDAEVEEPEQKEEKSTITTKKAVKDKKPDIRRPKPEKVEEDDDDEVQVIGLGENGEILGMSDDFEEAEPEYEPEPESEPEPVAKEKKGKKYKKNKKKQKREQQKKAENMQEVMPEADAEPEVEVVQTTDDEFIPDLGVDNVDYEEPDFVLLDEKLAGEESATDDVTIKSLNELTLSADFNDDFSKEISENIIVVAPNEESDNPIKHISDIIFKDDDTVEDVKSPVIEEAAEEIEKEEKKPKKGFFKKLFVRRSQKVVEQYRESIAQAAATSAAEQFKKEEPEKEEPKKVEPEKKEPKKEEPKKVEPEKEEPKKVEPKKEKPKKEEPKKEEPEKEESEKDEPKKEEPEKEEPKKEEPAQKKPKTEKTKMRLLKNKELKKAKSEVQKPKAPEKEVAKKANPVKEAPKKEEIKKVEPKKEIAKKPEPLSADTQSANSLSKNWKYNPEKNKTEPGEIKPEENFKSSLSAEDVKFEAISYEKFNKPLSDNSRNKGKADKNQTLKINELSVQLINQTEPSDKSESIARELKEKDILGIKLDVNKERPESILKTDANIEDTVGNIKKVEGIKVIGVTGKTGAGKGVVTRNLAANKKDTAVIDADKLYHALLENENMEVSIVFAFGQSVVGENGGIDRKKLAAVAFSSEENIRKLNRATHPCVAKEIIALIEDSKKKGMKTIYIDAPTLIESGLYRICDEIIFIKSPKDVRKKRIIQRDNLTDFEAEQRMRFEKNDKFYLKYANKVIEN